MSAAFPRTPALLGGCSGSASDWGEEGILSPARSTPRIALPVYIVVSTGIYLLVFLPRINGPSESAHHTTPLLVSNSAFILSLPLLDSSHSKISAALTEGLALAEMPKAGIHVLSRVFCCCKSPRSRLAAKLLRPCEAALRSLLTPGSQRAKPCSPTRETPVSRPLPNAVGKVT